MILSLHKRDDMFFDVSAFSVAHGENTVLIKTLREDVNRCLGLFKFFNSRDTS